MRVDGQQLEGRVGVCTHLLCSVKRMVHVKTKARGGRSEVVKQKVAMGSFRSHIEKMENRIRCQERATQSTTNLGHLTRFANGLLARNDSRGNRKQAWKIRSA